MQKQPQFARQALDTLLARAYADDNLLACFSHPSGFEEELAMVAVSWDHMADFYCIEGLVGGSGKDNPFVGESSCLVAGALDALEKQLPAIRESLPSLEWKKACLKLSSIIGRSYEHIDHGVNVLSHIHGTMQISDGDIRDCLHTIDELVHANFDNPTDIGKFNNACIRFHNWLPVALKRNDPSGDVYDSVCAPAKKAFEMSKDKNADIADSIGRITDATSPKGLALVHAVDLGLIGDRDVLEYNMHEIELAIGPFLELQKHKMATFSLDDFAFYTGLCGGKWKGIKLLHDAKDVLGLSYNVPEGFVISASRINDLLEEEGVLDILSDDIFHLQEPRRCKIIDRIMGMQIPHYNTAHLGSSLIARSSMYGEDGSSNFSGTFESKPCEPDNLQEAIRAVIASYFSAEATKCRQDVGLAHVPGISVIVQRRIPGIGGVIHITDGGCEVSFARTAEDAVQGNGTYAMHPSIDSAVARSPLESYAADLHTLYKVFGSSDIEFVIDEAGSLYLTQLRPKMYVEKSHKNLMGAKCVEVELDALASEVMQESCIVSMPFLAQENVQHLEGSIMDFIRRNRQYIIAVQGKMPPVAHIPNKIEGHFRIPYIWRSD